MTLSLKELRDWDERIQERVLYHNLRCFPQEFEVCDHYDMLGYMAYSGMPAHYTHWSYGKSYERQKTLYDYGVSGLPYEMVINSNPCLAYLMKDNSDLLQILTIAHVYGHNDFFANNFTFTSGTEAQYTLEKFKSRANRVDSYIEDPSIGLERVEAVLDAAHSLQFQRSRNLAITKLSYGEVRERMWQESNKPKDQHWQIHPPVKHNPPDLQKLPPKPERDILLFIANHNPFLPEWKRDLLRIVDAQAQYFIPQIETKIMNEGWASYWHFKIVNELDLPQKYHLEFLVRHNQVLRPSPGSINPYHLGFKLWHDIERRWNEGDTGRDFEPTSPTWSGDDDRESPGRKKIFEIRESDRDQSFLRRFLTPDLMRELNLFQHEKRGRDRIITKVADDDNWKSIKETLVNSVGMSSFPVINIVDADFGKNRTLYMSHEFDGRELLLEYAEATLHHVERLWERQVVLETTINNKRCVLRLEGGKLKMDRAGKTKAGNT
jgi:stage V sporulation protein R